MRVTGIGPVYLITLLYFISKGQYPIYDKFAHISLKMIEEKDCQFNSLIKDNYVTRLRNIFGKAYNDSNVDRALWVYSHLFNDNKRNRKRIKY